ncbi:cell division protein FtsL [Tepidibacillus marianensis]|uniref:cell division protein FtsL n=1 Tax=Tepidibacillus marianensis TaxID=3131995 RepID=UPI0030CEF596
MAYYNNGNLAYQLKEREVVQKTIRTKVKRITIPVQEKLIYLVAVLFVVSVASIIISNYAQIVEYNYSIQKQEQFIKKTQMENESLQLKIAELSSPERILAIAENKLGMKLNEQQVVMLSNQLHSNKQ